MIFHFREGIYCVESSPSSIRQCVFPFVHYMVLNTIQYYSGRDSEIFEKEQAYADSGSEKKKKIILSEVSMLNTVSFFRNSSCWFIQICDNAKKIKGPLLSLGDNRNNLLRRKINEW